MIIARYGCGLLFGFDEGPSITGQPVPPIDAINEHNSPGIRLVAHLFQGPARIDGMVDDPVGAHAVRHDAVVARRNPMSALLQDDAVRLARHLLHDLERTRRASRSGDLQDGRGPAI